MNKRKIRKSIFVLGWPASLEMGFQTLSEAINLLFVSYLGGTAVGAIGLVNTVMLLLLLSLATVGTGGSVLIAQYFGKGERDRISAYAGQIFLFGVLASVLIAISIVTNADTLLLRLGADKETAATGIIYLRVIGGSLPAALLSVLGGEVLRAVGESRIPFYVTSASLILNTGLNAVLIFGVGLFPALGIAGVAYATAFARILAVAVLAWYIFSFAKPLGFRLSDVFRFNPHITADIFRITWPVTVSESIWSGGSFLHLLMYTMLGQQVLAASQIVLTIQGTIAMFGFGLSVAGFVLVGQTLGSGQIDDVYRTANQILMFTLWLSAFSVMVVTSLIPLTGFLYPEIDQAAQKLIKLGLLVVILLAPISMVNMVLGNGILRGGGDTYFVSITDIFTVAIVSVPTAYFLGIVLKLGFLGVMLGRVTEEVVRILLYSNRFRNRRWTRVLTSPESFKVIS